MLKEAFQITNKTGKTLKITSSLPDDPKAISTIEMPPGGVTTWFSQPTMTSIIVEVK